MVSEDVVETTTVGWVGIPGSGCIEGVVDLPVVVELPDGNVVDGNVVGPGVFC